MQFEQSGSIKKPIKIDQLFFDQLKQLISDFQSKRLKSIASRNNVCIERVESIRDRDHSQLEELLVTEQPFDLKKQQKKLKEWRLTTNVLREIGNECSLNCSVSYDTGFSTDSNDMEQICSVIASESGQIQSLSFAIGQSHTGIGFRMQLENDERSGRFHINGSRDEVDHLYQSINRLIQSMIPEHAWMHNQLVQFIISFSLSIASVVTLITYEDQYSVPIKLAKIFKPFVILGSVILGAGLIIVLLPRLGRVFPRLESDFGPESRHRKSQRNILFGIMTIIVIPVILKWI